ncbi:hypothetical protein [Streptomyces anulatus]|uniref:hypothetical protein n=1 Tax=Streptomyces anulatus TaxID=1892 RepID=UPI0032510975
MTARDELRREMVHNHLYMTEERADELIDALLAEAANRVRNLHRPVEHRGRTICVECSAWGNGSTDNPPTVHPCDTIQALGNQEAT